MVPESTGSLQGLSPTIQGLVELAALVGTVGVAIVGYFRPKKAVAPEPEDKTVAVAIASPLSDANQLRQLIDAVERGNATAEHAYAKLEDICEAQERTTSALSRNEDAQNRIERAVRDVDDTISRQARR